MTRRMTGQVVAATMTAALLAGIFPARAGEDTMDARWRISVMGGWLDYEGDEPVKDTALGALAIGVDLSPRWTLEGVLEYCPELKSSYRRDWASGERISRLSESAGRDLSETSAIRVSLDGLLHLMPERRLDPYLAAGVGLAAYGDDIDPRYEPLVRAGAGLFANINPTWALRLDCRVIVAGTDTEANLITTAGLVFRPGAVYAAPPATVYAASPATEEVKVFVLNLNFDPGQSEIKSEYRSELDVVGRFLDTRSGAKARIEGHEQASEGTGEDAAQTLSEQRAVAVRDYLRDNWKIRATRMNAVGFGTTRPLNIPGQGNERIEVYVTAP